MPPSLPLSSSIDESACGPVRSPTTQALPAAPATGSIPTSRPLPHPSSFPAPNKAASKQLTASTASKGSDSVPSTPAEASATPINSMILSRLPRPVNPFPSANNPFAAGNTSSSPSKDVTTTSTPELAAFLAQAFSAQAQNSHTNGDSESFVSAEQLHPVGAAQGTCGEDRRGTSPGEGNSTAGPLTTVSSAGLNISRQVPAFLNKLRSMVDDKQTDSLICWAADGRTFVVPNNIRFAKEVLPRFFKHNNFSSFVRQLNMYGFHKVPSLQQGSLKHEQEMELWEFENENFLRDRPDLMVNMQRKRGHKGGDRDDEDLTRSAIVEGKVEEGLNSLSGALMRTGSGAQETESLMQLSNVWQAIQAIQSAQTSINDNLRHLHLSNDRLWQEAMEQKQRSEKQSNTISRMLRFLAGVFNGKDVLANGNSGPDHENGGTSSKSKEHDTGAAVGLSRNGLNGSVSPGQSYRNESNTGRLLIEDITGVKGGMYSEESDGGNQAGDGSERIQELFSRFSEAGSTSPESSSNSPAGPSSPTRTSPPSRFSQVSSLKEMANHSGFGQAGRPPLLVETPCRPSTPSKSRTTPNQILQALASGECQTFLQQLLSGNGGVGAMPGKLDPGVVSALQGALAAFQTGNDGSDSTEVGFPSPSQTESSRFIYPYQNTLGPDGQNCPQPQAMGAYGQPSMAPSTSSSGPLSQPLSQVDQSSEMLQNAINQLALICGVNAPAGAGNNGSSVGSEGACFSYAAFPPGALPSDTTPTPSCTMAPGDWNQYASVTPSAFQSVNGAEGDDPSKNGSEEFDLSALIDDSLMSNYLESPGNLGPKESFGPETLDTGKKRKSPEVVDTEPNEKTEGIMEPAAADPGVSGRRASQGNKVRPYKFGRTRVEDGE